MKFSWPLALRDRALMLCTSLAAATLILPLASKLPWMTGPAVAVLLGGLHLALVLLVFRTLWNRLRSATRSQERGFWHDLIWAVAIWMGADLLLVLSSLVGSPELFVAVRSLGAGAWLAVWLAASRNPHRRGHWRPRRVERRLHSIAAAVVAIGSIAYVVAPVLIVGEVTGALLATWQLLAAFSAFVLIRLVMLSLRTSDPRWRRVYGVLSAAAALIAWSHVEALVGPEPTASGVLGGPWAAIALTLLVLAARFDQLYHDDETGSMIGDPVEEGPLELEAPYLALAITLPLMHYGAAKAGWFEPELETLRQRLMVVWSIALASVSIYQQRRLEKWIRRTLDERSRLERSLQASRRRFQLMTEKEQTQDALQRSKKIYAKAFRDSPWAVALTSKSDGKHIQCSHRYLEAIGYSLREVIGKTTLELGIWVDAEQRRVMLERLENEGSVRDFEFTFRRKDGSHRPALFAAEPVEIEGESYLLSVSIDLGDIRLEEERSEAIFQRLETMPHAAWRLDLEDRVLAANPAAQSLRLDDFDADAWRTASDELTRNGLFGGELSIEVEGEVRYRQALMALTRDSLGLPSGKLLFMRLD